MRLVAADDRLLLAQRGAVPGLDVHVDPPGHEVASRPPATRRAGRRRPRTQTCSASAAASSAFTLAVPSLNPNRLRGVTWRSMVDEVRPKPSCDQRTAAVPNAIRARLRTACTATCGSSAQACTHRSPSLRARVERRRRGSAAAGAAPRAPVREAEPVPAVGVANSVGPKPNVMVRRGRRQPDAPHRCRPAGRRTAPAIGPRLPDLEPVVIRSRPRSTPAAARPGPRATSVVTSKAAKCRRSWAGVTMPAWWAPAEGVRPRRPRRPGVGDAPAGRAHAGAGRPRRHAPAGRRRRRAARHEPSRAGTLTHHRGGQPRRAARRAR